MSALIVGLAVGYLISIPIGPINIWVINTFFKEGKSNALAIAAGGSIMDFIYIYIALTGLSFLFFSDDLKFYCNLVGVILIFILGVFELIPKSAESSFDQKRNKFKIMPSSVWKGLFLGALIYAANPTLLVTMTAIGGFLRSLDIFVFSKVNVLFVAIGVGLGSFLWFVSLVGLATKYEEKIKTKYMKGLTKACGSLMVVLSLVMLWHLFQPKVG